MKTIFSILLLLCGTTALTAQQPNPTISRRPVRCHHCTPRIANPAPTPTIAPAVRSDFFVGEARVEVNKDETVVRLAMAQHGSVLIELPANDGPRYIIPGDPEMATVDQKALERNKRAIIVRPGSQFLPPARNEGLVRAVGPHDRRTRAIRAARGPAEAIHEGAVAFRRAKLAERADELGDDRGPGMERET